MFLHKHTIDEELSGYSSSFLFTIRYLLLYDNNNLTNNITIMSLFLKLFETTSQYNAYTADTANFIKPNVSLITETNTVEYNPLQHDYSKDYLTFISSSDNNVIGWKAVQQSPNVTIRTISYSTDKTNWTSVASTKAGVTLATLNSGDKLYLKGTENNYGKFYQGYSWSQFTSSGQFTAEGNIMSLIGGDNFSELTSFTSSNESAFCKLFIGCTSLTDVSNLILPATTLADRCYCEMFRGCTSLTTAPELPATTLANDCYIYMFHGCTSLTIAPELPATTLATDCYNGMFFGCTSLNSITCLATNISASSCTNNWVYNVASSGTFTKNASMSSWTTGTNGIPSNWTVVDAS